MNTSGSIFSDKNQNLSLNGTLGSLNYLGSFSITGVDGMSSSKSNSTSNFENDRYYSKNGLLKLGYGKNDKLSIETFLNYDAFEYDFDSGAFSDSDVNTGSQEQLRFGVKPTYKYNNAEVYLLASLNSVERNFQQFNSFSNTLDAYQFKGRSLYLDLVHKYEFSSDTSTREKIRNGNSIDTAPKLMGNLIWAFSVNDLISTEIEM